MEWVETTGKSLEEAKDQALDQLGVDEADAEFEVISEPSSSLFGFKKTDARVRARVRPSVPRAKDQNNRRKRKPTENKGGGRGARSTEAKSPVATTTQPEAEAETPKAPARRKSKPRQEEGTAKMDEPVELSVQSENATAFLTGFFKEAGLQADITVEIDETDENILIAVEGENLGHLIGPRGNALHALQELTRTAVLRQTGARNGRILLDISQYREKRRVALERFSRQIAEEVKAQQVTRMLEPMHPSDRKVVHDTINEIDGVETTSEGEEPRRRVVIKPASV